MNPSFFLLAALLLPNSYAMAGNWHNLLSNSQIRVDADEPQQEASESKDQEKAKTKEVKLKVWGKSTYSRPEQARPGDFYYASAKSLLAINCTRRTHRLMQKIYYSSEGQEIKSIRYGDSEKFEAIVPDSIEERIFDFACTFRDEKKDKKMQKRAQPKSVAPMEKPVKTAKVAPTEKKPQKPESKAPSKGASPSPGKSSTAKPKP